MILPILHLIVILAACAFVWLLWLGGREYWKRSVDRAARRLVEDFEEAAERRFRTEAVINGVGEYRIVDRETGEAMFFWVKPAAATAEKSCCRNRAHPHEEGEDCPAGADIKPITDREIVEFLTSIFPSQHGAVELFEYSLLNPTGSFRDFIARAREIVKDGSRGVFRTR